MSRPLLTGNGTVSNGVTPYDQAADNLGIEPEPMRRLPTIVSLVYDVCDHRLSEWSIEAQTHTLRSQGFVVGEVSYRYDPVIGHIHEWWGYRNEL